MPSSRNSRHRQCGRRARDVQRCNAGYVYTPNPTEPIVIDSVLDAIALAFEAMDLPVEHEMVVLLDARRRILRLLLDPGDEIGCFADWAIDEVESSPVRHAIHVVLRAGVVDAAPTDRDRIDFEALKRTYEGAGYTLLDAILIDGETAQSLAIACDDEPLWFDDFNPPTAA